MVEVRVGQSTQQTSCHLLICILPFVTGSYSRRLGAQGKGQTGQVAKQVANQPTMPGGTWTWRNPLRNRKNLQTPHTQGRTGNQTWRYDPNMLSLHASDAIIIVKQLTKVSVSEQTKWRAFVEVHHWMVKAQSWTQHQAGTEELSQITVCYSFLDWTMY